MRRHGFQELRKIPMTKNIVTFVLIIRASMILSIKRNLATKKVRQLDFVSLLGGLIHNANKNQPGLFVFESMFYFEQR